MDKIKNFIYLDDYKMYSMSSQVLGGVVHSKSSYEDVTKGASRNIEGIEHSELHEEVPIIEQGFGGVEHKHVHDYAYLDFENRLKKDGKIISLSTEKIDTSITQLNNEFVEIRGKATLIDMNTLKSTIGNLNEISKSLTNVVNFSEIELIKQQVEAQIETTNDRNEKVKLKQRMKSLINQVRAKNPPTELDKEYIKDLEDILEYGFRDQFVVQIPIGSYKFSAECNPNYFRENKDLLIRRFSRFPEPEFVIIGTISQSLNQTPNVVNDCLTSQTEEPSNMKSTIMNFIQYHSVLESSFTGREKDEIIIDPIAIYTEL
ncbi:MAG: hypothetical protein OXU23_17540 [Candidatus Poribacteria bacterium]|nr:hypothetical protein [Candidatus Poribacteria bacterium]